jgi:beta-hydroxylase
VPLLPPRRKLGRHRDRFAGNTRYHLGLFTPNHDACQIKFDGWRNSWRDGEAVFDGTA